MLRIASPATAPLPTILDVFHLIYSCIEMVRGAGGQKMGGLRPRPLSGGPHGLRTRHSDDLYLGTNDTACP